MRLRSAYMASAALAAILLASFTLPLSSFAQQQTEPAPPTQVNPLASIPARQSGQSGTTASGSQAAGQTPNPQQAAPQTPDQQAQHQPAADQQQTGMISGTIVDPTGNAVAGARVTLSRGDQFPKLEVISGEDGQFYLVNVAPGAFQLTIVLTGFTTQTVSGTLQPGEVQTVPRILLAVAPVETEVRVSPETQEQIAEQEIKEQEKQRVLGVVPNFYVTYVSDAAPLNSRQKFELAWKTTIDPVSFVITGAVAGIQQADNYFSGYGQGAQGYGKRFGAGYADLVTSTFIGGAILPSILKQDPRYFYKGTGGTRARILYAIANAVICKGDNKRWQPNYSAIMGSLAAGGISNLYYPAQNRNGLALTFENTLIGIGESAGANILEEFVIPKLTPKFSSRSQEQP